MTEWNPRRLRALLESDLAVLKNAAARDGMSDELKRFATQLLAELEPSPPKDDSINIKVVSQDGHELFYKVKPTTQFSKLINAYCQRNRVFAALTSMERGH